MFLAWGLSTWALAAALWTDLPTAGGRVGRWLLIAAGPGEALASVFDVTHEVGHGLAGLLGVGCLPIAAVLISASLDQARPWASTGRAIRRWSAHLTWLAVVLLIAAMALMTAQFARVSGGHLPQHAPQTLPPGVVGLDGWANRLIVLANCLWVTVVARQVIAVRRAGALQESLSPEMT
jgi:Protein of unknown function (DUF998)